MANPVEEFDSLLSSSEFLFAVYYRGHWCPFCMSYLKDLSTITAAITAAHGKTVIITAEPAAHLSNTRATTGYNEAAIIDPDHVLAQELKSRGLLDVAISSKSGYAHGMAQPAVLALRKDGTVLFRWEIVPGLMNLGGAADRPDLGQIWDNVRAQLEEKPEVHKTYARQGLLTVMRRKFFG